MRHTGWIALAILAATNLAAQTSSSTVAPAEPQSARQALIEMFTGKAEDAFVKHLPEDARHTLIRKGETPDTSTVLRISTLGRELISQGGQGEHIETFDTGPTLLLSEDKDSNEKLEVNVDHDSLIGEDDEIGLSFDYYKNGQLQPLPVVPSVTFTLRQEKDIWRLVEVRAAARVPLTDADYLHGLRKQQDETNEARVRMRLFVIAGTETNYAAKHPEFGYTCSLATLFTADAGEDGTPYDPGQGSDEWNGYRFVFSGCDGTPSTHYRLSAEPVEADPDLKTFCSDESGTVKFITGGKGSSCFSRGKAVNSPTN
ncbi:MAG TPA: hypothetical protein VMG31_08910 [Verrucomicrobiae bacterium]|nr:hypothetical protein [Verrucomicrobiae bacterium]